jgi:DNA polymerase-3 subunit chi
MATQKPTEVLFYHLERTPLEGVLSELLEKTLERGWRAVVQTGSQERLDSLDTALWTYREDSFLPHGTVNDGAPEEHPIYLTTGPDTPNGARVRFLVDGSDAANLNDYDRVVFLFDGRQDDAVARARAQWTVAKDAGHDVTYWQQNEQGRWEQKA